MNAIIWTQNIYDNVVRSENRGESSCVLLHRRNHVGLVLSTPDLDLPHLQSALEIHLPRRGSVLSASFVFSFTFFFYLPLKYWMILELVTTPLIFPRWFLTFNICNDESMRKISFIIFFQMIYRETFKFIALNFLTYFLWIFREPWNFRLWPVFPEFFSNICFFHF